MRTRLATGLAAAALSVATLVPMTVASAAPAAVPATAQRYVGCTWQIGHKDQTLACGQVFSKAGVASFSQCWRYRPASASVQRRVGSEWVRTPLRVRVFAQADSCNASVSWRSMVSVPVTARHPGKTSTYEIVLPATDKYRRTVLPFGVCVVSVGTTTPCA
jgi:hypothetical protein